MENQGHEGGDMIILVTLSSCAGSRIIYFVFFRNFVFGHPPVRIMRGRSACGQGSLRSRSSRGLQTSRRDSLEPGTIS